MEEQLYKTMYLKMMNACEEAMELPIRAQRECEELYLSQEDFPSQEIKKGAEEFSPFFDLSGAAHRFSPRVVSLIIPPASPGH